jgi:hypothetical protein
LGKAAGCCGGPGVGVEGATLVGNGVPQYPQNLLPKGNDFWHLGHSTWGTVGPAGARGAGVSLGAEADPVFCGFPQRTQAGADAGFITPHEGQRM